MDANIQGMHWLYVVQCVARLALFHQCLAQAPAYQQHIISHWITCHRIRSYQIMTYHIIFPTQYNITWCQSIQYDMCCYIPSPHGIIFPIISLTRISTVHFSLHIWNTFECVCVIICNIISNICIGLPWALALVLMTNPGRKTGTGTGSGIGTVTV